MPHTTPGAVTLEQILEAREGERLPLDVALSTCLAVAQKLSEFHVAGLSASPLTADGIRCFKGGQIALTPAPLVSQNDDVHRLGRLVYRLLSGSESVSEWPPSYFNPGVDAELDAVVMATVAPDRNGRPCDARVLIDAISGLFEELGLSPSKEGLGNLMLAVPGASGLLPPVQAASTAAVAVEPPSPVVQVAALPAPVQPAPAPVPVVVQAPVAVQAPVVVKAPAPRRAPRPVVETQQSAELYVPVKRFEAPAWLRPYLTPTRIAVGAGTVMLGMLLSLALPQAAPKRPATTEAVAATAQAPRAAPAPTPAPKYVAVPVAAPVTFKKAGGKKVLVSRR
ncbi:MAG: hypothetical protein K1X89_06290 [Myxococcaceae bacterium]|nr:hypothetical protein [Myxococcaceae bacterium]